MASLPTELVHELQSALAGDVRTDLTTRLLYSTDASIYQIEPLGVVFPRTPDDLTAAVSLAAQYQIPVLARGAGSSLAGQAIGPALILDTSRHLTALLEVNPEERTLTAEPGVILNTLNHAAGKHGLMFGPDPSSAERATLGGSVANNATGAHSITYGMAADHLVSAEVVLSDGSVTTLGTLQLAEAIRLAESDGGSRAAELYRCALDIRTRHADLIRQRWPVVWRRASGYNLNYLLSWSPTAPPQWFGAGLNPPLPYPPTPDGEINLAPLLAGSEGTLAVIRRLKVALVPRPKRTILGVLVFSEITAACDAVPRLLESRPSAIELIPGDLLQLARSIPAYERKLTFVQGNPAAILVVEYMGDDAVALEAAVRRLGPDVIIAASPAQQKQVWDIRRVGLGILNTRAGNAKPLAFIEDLTVPVERLGQFVRELELIMADHGTVANYYGHASTGCLHIRPILSIKDAPGLQAMRSIAERAVELTISLGGTVSGEHGIGIARAEWLERMFGAEIIELFRLIKTAADPHNLLNPGKILDAPPMDSNLRYDPSYQAEPWPTVLDYTRQGGLAGAIEMCNGAGVCRKDDGVMCPSYQVTRDELHSTRGRANLLRAMISGRFPTQPLADATIYQALDLCLACKGCKAECPSAVDMAKLRYEFANRYYQNHRRKLRDYIFGYIGLLAPLGSWFAPLANRIMGAQVGRRVFQHIFGLSARRKFPVFASPQAVQQVGQRTQAAGAEVLLLTDTFSHYFHPETEAAARRALEALGLHVHIIPVMGSGRTLISKGFLEPARRHAVHLLSVIQRLDPLGYLPIVGIEPSEIATFRDEFLDFFPADEGVKKLAQRAWMIEEFLIRPGVDGHPRLNQLTAGKQPPQSKGKVLLHGHCYQKAQPPAADGFPTGVPATVTLLETLGYQVELVDAGCCGMAGAFGYEQEHYEVSMKVGELALFPAIRSTTPDTIVAASGTSCRSQIEDGVGRVAIHPVCLIPLRGK